MLPTLALAGVAILTTSWVHVRNWQNGMEGWRNERYTAYSIHFSEYGLFQSGPIPRPVVRQLETPRYYTNYPPLYPVAASIPVTLFGENALGTSLVDILLAAGIVFILARLAARPAPADPRWAILAPLFAAVLPGLPFAARTSEAPGVPSLFGSLLVLLAYVRFAERPGNGRLTALATASVAALLTGWATLAAIAVCMAHLLLRRQEIPAWKKMAAIWLMTAVFTALFLITVYMSPGGGLLGLARFIERVTYYLSSSQGISGTAVFWPHWTAVFSTWRWMATLPVLLLGTAGLSLYMTETDQPVPISAVTINRLLLTIALVHAFSYRSMLNDWFALGIPVTVALAFSAGLLLASLPWKRVAIAAAAAIAAAGLAGIHWRLETERIFYAPVVALYQETADYLRGTALSSLRPAAIGTNLWIPEGFENAAGPGIELVTSSNISLLPHMGLGAYLAVNLENRRDLAPDYLGPKHHGEALHLLSDRPLARGETYRLVPLTPGQTDRPDTPLEVSTSLRDGTSISFRPPILLARSEIRIMDTPYLGHELLREAGPELAVTVADNLMTLRLPPAGKSMDAFFRSLIRYPWLLGRYRDAPVGGTVTLADGGRWQFSCPLPVDGRARCETRLLPAAP
ncbi:MAG: hypothetical protein KIT79_09185 [Deltaproteobacteria bacterium]|nr:hypothetical protein [Deltaproteobacteria bacterium]